MMNNPASPPFSVRLAGAFCIVCGTTALVNMGASIFRGDLQVDFGFVALFFARGLLMGLRSSRRWALTFSALGILTLLACIVWGIYTGQLDDWLPGETWPLGFGIMVAFTGCFAVFFGLGTAAAREWCSAGPDGPADRRGAVQTGWLLPLMIISALSAVEAELSAYYVESTARNLFHFRTQFEFRDAATGARVKSVGSSTGSSSSRRRRDSFTPDVHYSVSGGEDGAPIVEVTGISARPVPVTFNSPGCESVTYLITDNSPEKVTLTFQAEK